MKQNSMRPILGAQFMLSLILIYTGCGISVPQPEMLPSQLSGPSDTSRRVMLFIPPSVKETKAVWEFPYRGTTRTMTVIVGSPFVRLLTQGIKNRFPNLKVTRNIPISGSYDLLLTPDLDARIQGNRQGDAASVDLYITSNLHIQDSYKQVDTVTGHGRGNAGAANLWKVSKSGRMFSSSASGDMVVGMQLSSIGKRAGDQALSQVISQIEAGLSSTSTILTVEELMYYGNRYYSNGDYKKAILYYSKSIERDTHNPHFYYLRGRSYEKLRKTNDAIQDYSKGIAQCEFRAERYNLKLLEDLYLARADLYQLNGKFQKAINDYTEILKINPENSKVYALRADTYSAIEEDEKAMQDYKMSARLGNKYAQDVLQKQNVRW